MHQQPHFEHRVREFAYQIWESEGKPDGQADRHWDMAWKLAEAQTLGQQLLNGDAAPAKATRSRKKAEPNGAADAVTEEAASAPKATKKASTDKAEKPAKLAKADKPAKAAKAETAKTEKPVKAAKAADDAEKPKKTKKVKATDGEVTES